MLEANPLAFRQLIGEVEDGGDVWKLDRDQMVTTWIALDPATRANGCVQLIPASHHLRLLSTKGSTISDADVQHYCPEDAIEFRGTGGR